MGKARALSQLEMGSNPALPLVSHVVLAGQVAFHSVTPIFSSAKPSEHGLSCGEDSMNHHVYKSVTPSTSFHLPSFIWKFIFSSNGFFEEFDNLFLKA